MFQSLAARSGDAKFKKTQARQPVASTITDHHECLCQEYPAKFCRRVCGTICTTQPPPEIMVLRMRDVMSDAPAIEVKRSEIVGTQLKAGRQRLAELPKLV